MLEDKIRSLLEAGKRELEAVKKQDALTAWEVKFLGRKSELNTHLKEVKLLSPEERKKIGTLGNQTKQDLQRLFLLRKQMLESDARDFAAEALDVTAPGIPAALGHLHPITQLEYEIEDIFSSLGFKVVDGPEVESEYYNFDALNFPKDHPSRDMQDTFWIKSSGKGPKYLPRTHTSNLQVRYMEANTPPVRIIVPGRVYRNEATDASHEHTFYQFECLMADEEGKITVATFKYIAKVSFETFFGKKIDVRLRPSFFPFTEPSFEFDISCVLCDGSGCPACKRSGWLEIGGAGMVQQKVFEAAGYKRGKYQGFAWGFGLTRLAMMKYKITDIRLFLSGDLRFIRQF